MKTTVLIASGILLAALANTIAPVPAHALSMAECSAKYKAAKAAGTLNGMKWNDFRKAQCGSDTTAAPGPGPATTPPTTTTTTTPPSGGRQAMYARERECGKEWKAEKAAGTRPAGMKWPQFWHECDARMKAKGM